MNFKKCPRRVGLVVPIYRPARRAQRAQLQLDGPRKDRKGDPLKHELPGCSKKVDCLTSLGLPTIGPIGVLSRQRAVRAVIRVSFALNHAQSGSDGPMIAVPPGNGSLERGRCGLAFWVFPFQEYSGSNPRVFLPRNRRYAKEVYRADRWL